MLNYRSHNPSALVLKKSKQPLTYTTLLIAIFLSGCTNGLTPKQHTPPESHKSITIDNPSDLGPSQRACTMHYDPVCATIKNTDGTVTRITAGNACSASNIPELISYEKGECPIN